MPDKKQRKQALNQEEIWDKISESWNENKREVFPDVEPFLKKLSKENKEKGKISKILEIGCGNCRNLIYLKNKNFKCYGTDFSAGQLKQARKFCKEHSMEVELKKAEAVKLPSKDEFFDYILSIALLHHLKENQREKALQELKRVLKSKGKALMSVSNRYKEF